MALPRFVNTGLCGFLICRSLVGVLQFEGYWADLSDRGVPASAVVAVLDPGADRELGSGLVDIPQNRGGMRYEE